MKELKEVYSKLDEIKVLIETNFVGKEQAVITACSEYFKELQRGAE